MDYVGMRVQLRFRKIPDDSFENYVRKRFGNTLYRVFFGTYTEKTWQIPPSQISPDWAGQRITLLNLWDVVKKTLLRPRNVPRTYVSRFHYPVRGGIGAISQGYRRILEENGSVVLCGARVEKVEVEGRRISAVVYARDGGSERESVDRVVSTIPINWLVKMLDPPPPAEILDSANQLKLKAILFVYLMLDREKVTDDHWVYLPEKHLTVHRISEFKNFSAETCPPGKTLVCAEITGDRDDRHWRMEDEELAGIAIRDLETIGLIRREEVTGSHVRRVDCAYPLYDLDYRRHLQVLLRYLKRFENLTSTGRQGLFRYGNMDHSVAMGARVARQFSTGRGPDHAQVAADANESFDG
jgi:protoporphyrinogen oxidase